LTSTLARAMPRGREARVEDDDTRARTAGGRRNAAHARERARFCGECTASPPLAARRRRVNANAESSAAHPARGAAIARANEARRKARERIKTNSAYKSDAEVGERSDAAAALSSRVEHRRRR